MTKEKVVITGGAGFIGSNLCQKLSTLGYEVHAIDNLSSGKASSVPQGVKLHVADVRDARKTAPIFRGAKYVFHLAAMPNVEYSISHPEETHDVNVNGTHTVLSMCKKANVRKLIFASSASVYGDQKKLKLTENLCPEPKSPYALHKYIGEQYLRLWSELYELNTLSLRFFNVYGQGQKEEGAYAFVIAKFLKCKREKKPLPITGSGNQSRDFVHVSDVVDACVKAIKKNTAPGEVINIGSGQRYTIKKIAELIGGPIVSIPARVEQKNTWSDNAKAKKILGWKPSVSLKQGISDLIS